MPRLPKGSPPSDRLHKQTGQAIVSLPLGNGAYRDVLLGTYGTPESRAEYARVIAEWEVSGRRSSQPAADSADLSVAEVAQRFWSEYVERYCINAEGRAITSEVKNYRLALRPLRALYEQTPAACFGPLALKAVREKMVQQGLARVEVNRRVATIRRVFRWAVENELIPPMILHGLQCVKGLERGRTEAPETKPVGPVAEGHVDATLPFLNDTLRAMVGVQRHTGMRPGEVCRIRGCDIDMTGKVWLYRPVKHKNAWRGRSRVVAIGPKGQEVMRPWLKLSTQAFLFSPAEAEARRNAEKSAGRQTPMTPFHFRRAEAARKRKRRRSPRERYSAESYARAIARACDKAFPPPGDLARAKVPAKRRAANGKAPAMRWENDKEWKARLGERWAEVQAWREAQRWHPNQLRHSYLTAVRRRYGLEGAQVAAGHAKADVTQVYAERDLGLAEKIAAEIG